MATMIAWKLPSRIYLSENVKKNQFGGYGLRAYLGRYNVNIAKTSISFLTDKLGDKLDPTTVSSSIDLKVKS